MCLISVIVPCYNQAQYLNECLQSVFEQTYEHWECIIVNDGSPDNTGEVAAKWVERDPRFKYLYKENGGLSSARNAGIKVAKGDWIQFLDSDDILDRNKFQFSSSYFDTHNCIISDFEMFDDEKRFGKYCDYTNYVIDFNSLLYGWDVSFTIPIHAGVFQRNKITLFDEKLKAKEDWIFWLYYFKMDNISSIVLPEKLALYRYNQNSMTKDLNHMFEAESMAFDEIYYNHLTSEDDRYKFFQSRVAHKNITISNLNIRHSNLSKDYNRVLDNFFVKNVMLVHRVLNKILKRCKNY